MKWPQKLDKKRSKKLFKLRKNLLPVMQGASPSALPWSCDCCRNPDIRSLPPWNVPWSGTPANIAAHFWEAQRSFLSQRCSFLCGACFAGCKTGRPVKDGFCGRIARTDGLQNLERFRTCKVNLFTNNSREVLYRKKAVASFAQESQKNYNK